MWKGNIMATVELHPEIEPFREAIPIPDLDADNLPEVRVAEFAPPPELSDAVRRQDHTVSEDPEVLVRIHTPDGLAAPAPCLFSIHGGGYVIGSYDMDDAKLDKWCRQFAIVGVSVEYRLAPETAYPGALEDCYAALKWTRDNAAELGVDAGRIGITGISAGGGLCAALALLARDRGEVDVRFQLLDCPMLDDRQMTDSSQLEDLMIWSRVSNAFGWKSYLGDLHDTDEVPHYAAPARADDLAGLPEAYVCVGGADGFRDEDITYAMRLYGAGVPTELHVYPGAPHGVGLFVDTEIARRYVADQEDWLGRQLERIG